MDWGKSGGASATGVDHVPLGSRRLWPRILLSILLIAYGGVGLATVASRGVPWDEPRQLEYGRAVISWYSTGFQDRAAVDVDSWNLFLYGAAVEAPIQIVVGLTGGDPFLVRHVLLVLIALLGVMGTYHLAACLGGAWVGLLAAALLAASPRFFAHGSFNSKDIPFAVFYVWSLFLLTKDLDRKIGSSLWRAVPLGMMTGLLLGTRIGGGIVFVPILAGFARKWWVSGRSARNLVFIGARFSLLLLIAWGVMLISWPWAQLAPVLNPMVALAAFSDFQPALLELFGGRLLRIEDLPLSYVPVWLLRTLPEATLLGLSLLGSLLILRRLPARRFLDPSVLSTIVALGFPLVWVGLTGAKLYDGPRHLFFLQPLIASGAAVGIVGVLSRIPRRFGLVVLGAVGSAGLVTLVDAIRLHPHEHVYFNRISGGIPAAEGRFELDYWGLSYREGAEWLNENLPTPAEVSVASCSGPASTSHFLSDEFMFLGSLFFGVEGRPDYILYTAPHDCGEEKPWGEVVHEVTRGGVPLLTIVRTDSGDPRASGLAAGEEEGIQRMGSARSGSLLWPYRFVWLAPSHGKPKSN